MSDYPDSFAWNPGEREAFATTEWNPVLLEPGRYLDTLRNGGWFPNTPYQEWSADIWATCKTDWERMFRIMCAPEEISLAALDDRGGPSHAEYPLRILRAAVSRFELRALPFVLEEARRHPKDALAAFGPFDVAALAPTVAKVLHGKKLKPAAEAWLKRHPDAAKHGLAADAAGKGPAKKAALAALAVVGV